jgi:hypothetical protein
MATNEEIENLLLKESIAADNFRRIQDEFQKNGIIKILEINI